MSHRQITSLARQTLRSWATSSRFASTSTEAWTRPIAAGVNPAYDAALELLESHSQQLLRTADELRSQTGGTDAETASLQRRVKQLEVEARLADPRLRSTFAGMEGIGEDVEEGEASALRTLAERKWKKEGRLDRLVCRIPSRKVACAHIVADATSHPNERDTRPDPSMHADHRHGCKLRRIASSNGWRTGSVSVAVTGMSSTFR
jgi:hypothetical protein